MTYKLDIIKQLAKCLVSLSRFLYYNNSLLYNSYESGIEYWHTFVGVWYLVPPYYLGIVTLVALYIVLYKVWLFVL